MYVFLVFLTSWTSIFFIGINGCFDKNKKYALSLLLYLILTALAGVNFGGQSITFFYLLGLFIFATFRRPHKLLNCFGVVYSYLMVILADYLFQTGILFLFHISTVEMSVWQYLFTSIFYIPYIYLITKLSSLLLFRIIRIQTFYQNALVPVYVLNLGLCLMIFVLFILYGETIGFPPEIIQWCFLLFTALFLCNNLLFYLVQRVVKKEAKLESELEIHKQLESYTKDLENINESMRSFKHDYINILTTLKEYIENQQITELSEFFHKKILPLGYGLTQDQEQIDSLHNLKVPELKGLLSGKCSYALNRGLHLQIQIPFVASMPSIDIIPFARILGIFLDNAIESASQSTEKILRIDWYASDSKTIIRIQNSIALNTPSIQEIQQKQYSPKPNHEGIGLENVKSLLNNYPNVFWHMRREEKFFCQELKILSKKEGNTL